MKYKLWTILILLLVSSSIYAQLQPVLSPDDIISIPKEFEKKIGSGELIKIISEKQNLQKRDPNTKLSNQTAQVVIYLEKYPTADQFYYFQSLGLYCFEDTWTPPVFDHPYGYFFAELPVEKLIDVLALDFVKKIDSSEQLSFPQNNEADRILNADEVWAQGWTGDGIKVAVLDSGLDTDPSNDDLPSDIIKKDYSSAMLDDDVENQVTGHGTHVTGSVLGRGILSNGNVGNGGSPYKGVAPSASLVFLKIGNDYNAGASTNAIVNAMDAAVNIYEADIISMSYGYWDAYHDGSSTQDQKVDWCYNQGVPVFLAAGNDGTSGRHYSGTVPGNDSTDFISVNVTGAVASSYYLYFNLVWPDGIGVSNNLNFKYYDETFQEITNVYNFTQTESTRGTESRYSKSNFKLPAGNSIYYLRIINYSPNTQSFHIYEKENNGKVSFDNPDPDYTIVTPSTATYSFSVGAFNSRVQWDAYNGSTNSFNENQDEIMSFSSRGPRIDELQKPDIVAPGSAIISIRDRDVITTPDLYWVDNDGNTTGDVNYYVMQGTSMSAPQCAGAAALFFEKFPNATVTDLYDAFRNYTGVDEHTGVVPNSTYGYGKLDIYAAINSFDPLPVELTLFSAVIEGSMVHLNWRTETEVNNYGFEIERSLKAEDKVWKKIGFIEGYGNSNSPKQYSFTDQHLTGVSEFLYRLKQIDNDGKFAYSDEIEVMLIPTIFELAQNYPNPFNPSTTIKYQLPVNSEVTLKIYDLLGNEVITLLNEEEEAGTYKIIFDASNYSSGVYFYQLQTEGFVETKKMILLR